jgi:hypothetical protein
MPLRFDDSLQDALIMIVGKMVSKRIGLASPARQEGAGSSQPASGVARKKLGRPISSSSVSGLM